MGITKLKNRCYRELSGGQQQRVLLARALCATKKVILLDEPAAGLDPVVTQNLYELIRQINEDMGITIIMVSHDIHAAVQYAKHIAPVPFPAFLWYNGGLSEQRSGQPFYRGCFPCLTC